FFAALPWHRRQEPQWERRLVANSYCQERLQSAFGIGAESRPLWLGQCLDARPKRFTPLLAVFTGRCSTTSRQNLVQLGKGAGEKLGFAKWPASGCVPSTPPLDCPLKDTVIDRVTTF